MNKDQTLQAIVDHYELSNFIGRTTRALSDAFDNGISLMMGLAYDAGRKSIIEQIQSTVSRLQSEKDDANLYNKRKLQSQILILEQIMEDNSVRFRILPPNKHR